MAVKLARYVFKRIRGRIVPIRIGLERATKSQNKLADKVNKFKDADSAFREAKKISPMRKFPEMQKQASKLQKLIKKEDFKKIGSGVDFDVFGRKKANDFVIKTEKVLGGKVTKGTANKAFTRKYPELADKLAVNKTLGDNLPDFGFDTVRSEILRLKKGRRGILQEFIPKKRFDGSNHYIRQQDRFFRRDHGLSLDVHAGNVINNGNTLVDTGGALSKSSIKELDDVGKEVLGIDNNFGTNIKDVYNKSTIMSDEALLSGQSKKLLRKVNAMIKKGYRYKKSGPNEYKLVKKFTKDRKQ